jgi:hypothetical protein
MKAIRIIIRQYHRKALLAVILGFISMGSHAQIDPTDSLPDDPGAISVSTVQHMSFGAFSNGGTGGTLTVSTSGSRSATGSIVPLNLGRFYFQAIFDIGAPQGSIISILFGADASLTGSNGGSMLMHVSGSDPPSPFITIATQPARTPVKVAGILSVGSASANPPGAYSGTFYIIFNHE